MALLSGHMMAFLARLIPTFFLWNILAHHLGNILTYLTMFIPIFSWGTCLQGCLGSSQHFSLGTSLHCIEHNRYHCKQDCLQGQLHYLTFSVEHSQKLLVWHSLTLPVEPTLSKTVLHLSQQPVYIDGHSQPCTGNQSQFRTLSPG